VRGRASPDAPVLGTLDNGDEVVVAGRSGAWVHISKPLDGWVWAGSLRGHCQEPPLPD